MRELVIDNFAGGGGASTGIELAIGRHVDVAINHDPIAIAMHKANYPGTYHYCENVWDVDPRDIAAGRPVGLVWLSPDCKHFSKAKGGKPVSKDIRGLAWVAVRWAATVKPRVIILENVEEFKTWGPLAGDRPDPKQKGRTFGAFVNALKKQGYHVEYRELRACDYGAPTIRKRLFLVARCDGQAIRWPKPTHGDPASEEVKSGKLKPWRTAAEILDWSLPCPSIFDTAKEIKKKYGIKAVRPVGRQYDVQNSKRQPTFNAPLHTVTARHGYGVVAPFLSQYHSYKDDGARGQVLNRPLLTVDTNPRYALTAVFISKYYGTGGESGLTEPLHTFGEIRTVLTKISGNQDLGHWPEIRDMLNKYCGYSMADDEILLLQINGDLYFMSDIGMRMLEPHELFAAQGFPGDYIIDRDEHGKKPSKATQVALCGNSVPPALAEALVRSNLPEMCAGEFERAGVR